MRKAVWFLPLMVLMILPSVVDAHERQVFEINGQSYEFTVGSLNEPIVVDDKTGVEFRVIKLSENTPVTGLEQSLKVELKAGDKNKTLDLTSVYNTPGSYKAPFYPTVATTYSYRFFGTLEGTPLDVTFICNSAGHGNAEESKERVEISDKVVRTLKTGAFSCPVAKAEMGFPEPSADLMSLKTEEPSNNKIIWGAWAIALAALGLSLIRRHS